MRLLKVIILVVFVLSLFPLGAFCSDSHQQTKSEHEHCVLMCHSVCAQATAVDRKSVVLPAMSVMSCEVLAYNFSYQNPSLDIFKRPPVVTV